MSKLVTATCTLTLFTTLYLLYPFMEFDDFLEYALGITFHTIAFVLIFVLLYKGLLKDFKELGAEGIEVEALSFLVSAVTAAVCPLIIFILFNFIF